MKNNGNATNYDSFEGFIQENIVNCLSYKRNYKKKYDESFAFLLINAEAKFPYDF